MPATTTYAKLQRYIRRTAAADGATSFDDDKIRSSMADGFRLLDAVRGWSFLRRTKRIVTADPYEGAPSGTDDDGNASSVAYTDKSATVTGTNTEFMGSAQLDGEGVLEGDQIEVNGEQTWYEVAADATSETSLTLRDKYRGTAASGKDFIIVRPAIALPGDFKDAKELIGLGDVQNPEYVDPEYYLDLNQNYAGASLPHFWTHMQKYDDDAEYLMLYPPPDAVYQFDLRYNRRIGFLDTSASNAWFDPTATEPASDDIVLWDDREMAVLRAAIILAAYQEFGPTQMVGMAQDRFERQRDAALARDSKNKKPEIMGARQNKRPYWY